MEALLLELQPN